MEQDLNNLRFAALISDSAEDNAIGFVSEGKKIGLSFSCNKSNILTNKTKSESTNRLKATTLSIKKK